MQFNEGNDVFYKSQKLKYCEAPVSVATDNKETQFIPDKIFPFNRPQKFI